MLIIHMAWFFHIKAIAHMQYRPTGLVNFYLIFKSESNPKMLCIRHMVVHEALKPCLAEYVNLPRPPVIDQTDLLM